MIGGWNYVEFTLFQSISNKVQVISASIGIPVPENMGNKGHLLSPFKMLCKTTAKDMRKSCPFVPHVTNYHGLQSQNAEAFHPGNSVGHTAENWWSSVSLDRRLFFWATWGMQLAIGRQRLANSCRKSVGYKYNENHRSWTSQNSYIVCINWQNNYK